MDKYYIALNPEKKLVDQINNQKSIVREMIGEQTYLSHPPHFTLIIFTTEELSKIILELERFALNTNKIMIKINDFHIFYNDIFTKANTITYPINKDSLSKIKNIQIDITKSIERFNTKKFISKGDEKYCKMSEIEKINVDEYGYPFIGENWIPHITLASVDADKFGEVFEKIKQKPAFGEFLIESINLYKVGEKTSELIRSFELN